MKMEEEGSYEWASYHKEGEEEGHPEEGVLYQPLSGEGAGEGATLLGSAIPKFMGVCSVRVHRQGMETIRSARSSDLWATVDGARFAPRGRTTT
jgi:hypothetical protein